MGQRCLAQAEHFKDVRALLELGDLLDQWGTSLVHAYEVNSRDLDLRHRYEKQLCLKSTPWAGCWARP